MVPAMTEEAAVRREVVPMNILIVDDEQSIRETCATVSEQCGMKAAAVATAEEALEVLEHSAIDIVLTDLKLPRSNGVGTAETGARPASGNCRRDVDAVRHNRFRGGGHKIGSG